MVRTIVVPVASMIMMMLKMLMVMMMLMVVIVMVMTATMMTHRVGRSEFRLLDFRAED